MHYLTKMLMNVSVVTEVGVNRAVATSKARMSVHVNKDMFWGVMASIAVVSQLINHYEHVT